MVITKGMKLKRKNYNYEIVEVIDVTEKHIKIKDKTGEHFVEINKIEENFTENLQEPEVD